MISVTEIARQKILELLTSESRQGLALRLGIEGRGAGGFRYRLGFAAPEERRPDDVVVDAAGFEVWVDPASAAHLNGASIDYVETLQESGFKIDNPNPAWTDPTAAAVQRLLDSEINPAIASHGGHVELLDVKEGVAYISMGGGCRGCGMADVTLRQGVEVRIRDSVPAIHAVVDTTDHAGGTNPYYRPAQSGHSPLE